MGGVSELRVGFDFVGRVFILSYGQTFASNLNGIPCRFL